MEKQGHHTELKRDIGLFTATALVVANMVGTGIFTTSGFVIGELGSPYVMLLCWIVGAIFALCGALCYGELGARFPGAGGEYLFLKKAFGRPMGFLSGWISLIVGFSAPIAAAAITFATYFLKAMSYSPDIEWSLAFAGLPSFALSPRLVIAIGVVGTVSILHCHSLKLGSRVQNVLTLFKVGLILFFIVAGLTSGNGSFKHLGEFPGTEQIFRVEFAVALIFVSFAYSGWNAAAYLGGEIERPRRNIPLALLVGTIIVSGLYILLNLVYIYALPPEKMSGLLEIGAAAANTLFGKTIGALINAAIAVGLLSVLSAMILTGPRVYYAMARDGLFFRAFGRVDACRHTPGPAIGLQAGLAVVMILTAAYDLLLLYIGFTLSLSAMLTVAGLIRLRIQDPLPSGMYSTFAYPIPPLVFILGNLWIVYVSVINRPGPILAGVATLALGLCFYVIFGRRSEAAGIVEGRQPEPVSVSDSPPAG